MGPQEAQNPQFLLQLPLTHYILRSIFQALHQSKFILLDKKPWFLKEGYYWAIPVCKDFPGVFRPFHKSLLNRAQLVVGLQIGLKPHFVLLRISRAHKYFVSSNEHQQSWLDLSTFKYLIWSVLYRSELQNIDKPCILTVVSLMVRFGAKCY